jgi:hypothetical protein
MTTASNLITKFSNFATDAVHFGGARPNSRGGKNVPLFDKNGNKLVLSLPKSACWGMNENIDEASGRKSYSINLRLTNDSPMTEKFQALEDWVVAQCVSHGKDWFGKASMSEDVVRALFYPILKYPKDKATGEPDTSRDPSVKLKVPYWEGEYKCELYSMDSQPLYTPAHKLEDVTPIEMVPMNSDIKALVQCDGLWFTAGRCGITFKLLQAKIEEPVRLEGGCFLDDSDDEAEEVASEVASEVKSAVESAVIESDHSDAEPEPEAAAEPSPEPEPVKAKPKRKRLVKKKAGSSE